MKKRLLLLMKRYTHSDLYSVYDICTKPCCRNITMLRSIILYGILNNDAEILQHAEIFCPNIRHVVKRQLESHT